MRALKQYRGLGSSGPEDEAVLRKTEAKAVGVAESRRDAKGPEAAQFPENLDQATNAAVKGEDLKAWELIDADVGRYMPRRIRGSFRGRALG